jgi:hypothetical protein
MNLFFYIFDTDKTANTIMTSISLRKIPDDLHWEIKLLQRDLEKKGIKNTLEEIYIDLIEKGLNKIKQETPTK